MKNPIVSKFEDAVSEYLGNVSLDSKEKENAFIEKIDNKLKLFSDKGIPLKKGDWEEYEDEKDEVIDSIKNAIHFLEDKPSQLMEEINETIMKELYLKNINLFFEIEKFNSGIYNTIASLRAKYEAIIDKCTRYEKILESIELKSQINEAQIELSSTEHHITGHAMTLMGVLAAIITLVVTLTATSIQVMKSFDFYEQFLIILGIGVVIVASMVFLLLISAFFFADKDRRPTATKGLMLSAKIAGVILYFGFDFLCIFFFIEKIYVNINNAYKNTLGFQVLIAAFMVMVVITTICFIWFVKRFSFSKIEIEKISKKRKNTIFQKNIEILEQHNSEELEKQLEQNSVEQKVMQGPNLSSVQFSDKGEKASSIEQNKNSNMDNSSKVQVHLVNKHSIICYLMSMIILLVLCYIFFVSYYSPSRELSEKHSQEIKMIVSEYKVEEIDGEPTNIIFTYEEKVYIIAYDVKLFHDGNLYFCEEHKTLE